MGLWFDYMENYNYENPVMCQDKSAGLKAVIAIHDTTLGPASGGCRMWPYRTESEAIEDALRLARGMTYKHAAAGVNLGGGKAVIIGDPKRDKSEALFRTLGRFIHRLGGLYLTGEDVGTTLEDMAYIRMETPYVDTLPKSWGGAGPIAPATALGVLNGMQAALKEALGTDSLQGRKVAVQGIGAVGFEIVKLLCDRGADVLVGDIDPEKVRLAQNHLPVRVVPDAAAMYELDVDVFCPCALGGILNDATVPKLRCKVVAGSANNQLKEDKHGLLLHERGILYAPDYIINAGGAIYDYDRSLPGGMNPDRAIENVKRIRKTTEQIIEIAKRESIPTYLAADRFAERRIASIAKVRALRVSRNGDSEAGP